LDNLTLETTDFATEKEFNKFVNAVKSIVRKSPEYTTWVKYIKYTLGYKYCQFTHESADELTIDLHHHPIGMQNICEIVVLDILSKNNSVTSLDAAMNVLKLHYDNNVGYVLLVSSLHEKFHNGNLQIPMNIVIGNWKYIIKNYYIPERIQKVINGFTKIQTVNEYTWQKDQYLLLQA
jgi:hypothetical protein